MRRGFSLIELVVVISVAVLLTGLLMPAMSHLHENAHRVVCMSNQGQLGQGFIMYGHDHNDWLPPSSSLHQDDAPQDLMVAYRGAAGSTWDGLGILFDQHYVGTPQCYYCPSHHGEHPFERYADLWSKPVPGAWIYTNYHYAGDVDWKNGSLRRSLLEGYRLVLLTDGLRTATDFNHRTGYNAVRADGSVRWKEDTHNISDTLPATDDEPVDQGYTTIWDVVESPQ